jgi:hypothetical protein
LSFLFKKTGVLESQIDDFLDAVSEGAIVFKQGIASYLGNETDLFNERVEMIGKLESRADELRREIERHLYQQSLIPESRGDVLGLLETMDGVIDTAKATLTNFQVEQPELFPGMGKSWQSLADTAAEATEAVVLAARAFFRDPRAVHDNLHKVYFYEKEGDKIAQQLKREIFASDEDLSRKIHLRYFALNIDLVSDTAEDVADRLNIYTIKRMV